MTADFFYFSADIRAELSDVFRNGTGLSWHGLHPPCHIGNIHKRIVSQEEVKHNRKMNFSLFYNDFCV